MKPFLLFITLASLLFLPFCSHLSLKLEAVIYRPPVVFAGMVNDDYDSLPGNAAWPNTCELLGDTLRMHFYSDSFHVAGQIWYGDHLILTLLPNANDTLIGTRSVFLHMARYSDGNYSYSVSPADSTGLYNNQVEMRAISLTREHGSRIDIINIKVQAQPLGGNAGSESLVINDGRISGTVQ